MADGSGMVISHVQGVTVATLRKASILDGADVDAIGAGLYEIVDNQACRKLIVDFRAVGFLASAMLGVIIALDNKSRSIKGTVVLCGLRGSLMKVFKIMKLDKRLTFASDEDDAMKKLGVMPM